MRVCHTLYCNHQVAPSEHNWGHTFSRAFHHFLAEQFICIVALKGWKRSSCNAEVRCVAQWVDPAMSGSKFQCPMSICSWRLTTIRTIKSPVWIHGKQEELLENCLENLLQSKLTARPMYNERVTRWFCIISFTDTLVLPDILWEWKIVVFCLNRGGNQYKRFRVEGVACNRLVILLDLRDSVFLLGHRMRRSKMLRVRLTQAYNYLYKCINANTFVSGLFRFP